MSEDDDTRLKIVCDTSVINALWGSFKQNEPFPKGIKIIIPSTMLEKEKRSDNRLKKYMEQGIVGVEQICDTDRKEIAKKIEKYLPHGKNLSKYYLDNRKIHNSIEYDVIHLGLSKNLPILLFDKQALTNAKKILSKEIFYDIKDIREIAYFTNAERRRIIKYLERMRYCSVDESFKLIENSSRKKRKRRH